MDDLINESVNELITEVFVEQPLVSTRSNTYDLPPLDGVMISLISNDKLPPAKSITFPTHTA